MLRKSIRHHLIEDFSSGRKRRCVLVNNIVTTITMITTTTAASTKTATATGVFVRASVSYQIQKEDNRAL